MAKGYTATEKQLMDAIIETALQLNYQVCHIPDKLYAIAAGQGRYDALSGAKGFVDILIVGYGALFAIETKGSDGKTFEEQDSWLEAFTAFADGVSPDSKARVHVMVARPEDQDYVQELLTYYRERSWAA